MSHGDCSVSLPNQALCHFHAQAIREPGHAFVRIDDDAITRHEFLVQVESWAQALVSHGVKAGDYIALITPNGLTWLVAFWASVRLGARPVPLDPQIGAWELERLFSLIRVKLALSTTRFRAAETALNLRRCSARESTPPVLVCLDSEQPGMRTLSEFLASTTFELPPMRTVEDGEPLMLACTSGTTGNPKIIEVPHSGFVRSQLDMAKMLGIDSEDRMLLGMPLYHQGGFGMGLQTLLGGAEALYLSQFDPTRFLETIEARRVTIVQLSATLAKILISHPKWNQLDLSSLRLAYFAGEVLPDDVAREFWQKRRIRVVNVIGSSETATMVLWDSARDSHRSPSEYGPLPFTQVHVGDWDCPETSDAPGTLWVSTDALVTRYYANPSETERRLREHSGRRWFNTEDLVQRLPDGYVRFVGRLKRAMKRGTNLVHPEEVEAFLLTHPGVAAVAVEREDHELFGDGIVAKVQAASGVSLKRGDLLRFCRGAIAAYKIPDRFDMVVELPVEIGKLQYHRLREHKNMQAPSTLNQQFEAALAAFAPDRTAFAVDRDTVTFSEFAAAVRKYTKTLQGLGIGENDVVGYSLPNGKVVLPLFLAISVLGASAVPLFPQIPDVTRAGIFAALGCKRVFCADASLVGLTQAAKRMGATYQVSTLETLSVAEDPGVLPLNDVPPEHFLLASATSGTTGAPKSVFMTQANVASLIVAARDFARIGPWQTQIDYTTVAAFPLSTSSALVVLGLIFAGVKIVVCTDLSPVHYLAMAEHHQADTLSAPPAYLESILGLPKHLSRPLPSVKGIVCGMDFLEPSLIARLLERYSHLECAASGYGLVETSTVFAAWKANHPSELGQVPNRFTLCEGAKMQFDIRDDQGQTVGDEQPGELWVRGKSVVSGYLGGRAAGGGAFVEGWFRTGDEAKRIDASTFELLGRRKYLIKRGGKSVSPIEVQAVIDRCPGVAKSAVVGVKHPLYGEMIWAFVEPEPSQCVEFKDVMKACRSTLPNYMVPDQAMMLERLPRGSGVGKLDREKLIAIAEAELGKLQGEARG